MAITVIAMHHVLNDYLAYICVLQYSLHFTPSHILQFYFTRMVPGVAKCQRDRDCFQPSDCFIARRKGSRGRWSGRSLYIKVAGRVDSYSAFGACFHPRLVSGIARTLRKAPPAGEISIDLQSKGGHR